GTRQAVRQRTQEAPHHAGARLRLPRPALAPVPQGEGAGHPLDGLLLPGPSRQEGRVPQALDPAHQRRGPRGGPDLQPLHPGPQGRRDRGRPQDPGRHGSQRPGVVHGHRRARQGRAAHRRQRAPRGRPGGGCRL
ncbi:MAG: LSU ribosomal protein L20p, partial [uncultured Nocardioidaceae bacterium]